MGGYILRIKMRELRRISKDRRKKHVRSKDEIHIQASMYPFSREYTGYLELLDAYQSANIIDNMNDWKMYHTKMNGVNAGTETYNPYKFYPRDIVLVKLGGTNYGYEASYVHPGVVVSEGYNWVLIAPCSTGRYGKGKPTLLDAVGGVDGVRDNTGIQIDNLRVIDKWRIINKVGRLGNTKFNELTNRIIEIHHPYHHNLINGLKNENEDLKTTSIELEDEKEKISLELVELQEKYDTIVKERDALIEKIEEIISDEDD